MKTEKNILIAFILNLLFSCFEFVGGTITGSVAIMSDAVHDMGDAVSIGLSYFLERKSKREPDEIFTYGYGRYSVIGGLITTVILLVGSVIVVFNAVLRIFNPVEINYDGMILFSIVGVMVNFIAAYFTHGGNSLNQRAVNLHMLEDVLGWAVVLAGAIIMRFTDISLIDPIMSIIVSVFILVNAVKNLIKIQNLFLERTPDNIKVEGIKSKLLEIDGILDVHHIHVWSMDGHQNFATMHVVSDMCGHEIKEKIREEMQKCSIDHVTIELEKSDEHCHGRNCNIKSHECHGHHHHH